MLPKKQELALESAFGFGCGLIASGYSCTLTALSMADLAAEGIRGHRHTRPFFSFPSSPSPIGMAKGT